MTTSFLERRPRSTTASAFGSAGGPCRHSRDPRRHYDGVAGPWRFAGCERGATVSSGGGHV